MDAHSLLHTVDDLLHHVDPAVRAAGEKVLDAAVDHYIIQRLPEADQAEAKLVYGFVTRKLRARLDAADAGEIGGGE